MENTTTLTAEQAYTIALNTRLAAKNKVMNRLIPEIRTQALLGRYECFCTFYETIYSETCDAIVQEITELGYKVSTRPVGKGGLGIKIEWAK